MSHTSTVKPAYLPTQPLVSKLRAVHMSAYMHILTSSLALSLSRTLSLLFTHTHIHMHAHVHKYA